MDTLVTSVAVPRVSDELLLRRQAGAERRVLVGRTASNVEEVYNYK